MAEKPRGCHPTGRLNVFPAVFIRKSIFFLRPEDEEIKAEEISVRGWDCSTEAGIRLDLVNTEI